MMLDRWLDVFALQPHFLDHLIPVWNALPSDVRARIYTRPELFGRAIGLGASRADLQPWEAFMSNRESGVYNRPVLVCSNGDIDFIRKAVCPRQRAIWLEHGTGQSWACMPIEKWRHSEEIILWLLPGPAAGRIARKAYPHARIAEVGCPKLDRWHPAPATPDNRGGDTIAISFHWPNKFSPETMDALGHFRAALPELKKAFPRMLGHAHPLCGPQMAEVYAEHGIEYVPEFEEVMRRADIYASDCSSTIYEFASSGRPVVLMNPPWYRRDLEQGLRFWEAAHVGTHCDDPADLVAAFRRAPSYPSAMRRAALAIVYAPMDGWASSRAAKAIMEVL